MKQLLTFGFGLGAAFASTLLLLALVGGFGAEELRDLAESVARIDRRWVALLVVGLLWADLFVAMPTMTLCLLAGYYLGAGWGGAAASAGMLGAGVSGYWISKRWGVGLLRRICRDEAKLAEVSELFGRRGPVALLLCRAAPILPEVSSCLAGATGMGFGRYLLYFGLASVPYGFVAALAGSASSLEDARPAVFTGLALTLGLWGLWWRVRAAGELE